MTLPTAVVATCRPPCRASTTDHADCRLAEPVTADLATADSPTCRLFGRPQLLGDRLLGVDDFVALDLALSEPKLQLDALRVLWS